MNFSRYPRRRICGGGFPACRFRRLSYLFTEGGAGDPPAPPGDPPGGVVVKPGRENTALFLSMPRSVPSGRSPDGTGESPVLPTVNTYELSSPRFAGPAGDTELESSVNPQTGMSAVPRTSSPAQIPPAEFILVSLA